MDRVARLMLLGRCVAMALWRGRAVHAPKKISTIVVVLTGKLGDIVCGTPVLRALRAHYPGARLVVAGAPVLAPLLADSGLADECLDIDRVSIAELAALAPDVGLVTGPSFTPAAKLFCAGVPLVAAARALGGTSPSMTWPYALLRRLIATYPYRFGAYAPRERLRALEPLGIVADDTTKHLGFSKAAEQKIVTLLPKDTVLVGISATAGNKIKEWPPERFAAVADHVVQKHDATVVLVGGPDDAAKTGEVLRHMTHADKARNLQGTCTIDELKALIAKLTLFIAVDTGPIYIAEAFGVPTVDIVGPMDEREQPPQGAKHAVVVPPYTRVPQLHILNARRYDAAEATRQTLSISAGAVTQTVDGVLHAILKP